jgi:hypothetical protein
MEATMVRSLFNAASAVAIAAVLAACGRGNKENFQASVDSMSVHRDSAVHALDSGQVHQVDTTKLGAAKTESILTKARKTP